MRKATVLVAACLVLGGCAPTAHRVLGPELARARADGAPVLIYALGVPGQIVTPKSRVAVPVYIQFVVTSRNPIDEISFRLTGYSPRGMPVLGRDGGHMSILLLGQGPFTPDGNYEVNSFHSSPAGFPGGNVACISLTLMEVTFVNGQRAVYGPTDLHTSMTPQLRKGCGDQGIQVDRMMGGGGP